MIGFKNTLIGFKTSLFEIENLDLFPGNLYLLAGKNGTGKTTFITNILTELNTFLSIKRKSPTSLGRCV